MAIFDDIVRRIGRVARKDARAFLMPALLAFAGGLSAVAGLAFLVASAYLALGAVVGQGLAALLTGSGLLLISSALVFLARGHAAPHGPTDPMGDKRGADAAATHDAASQIAFATAFVLARYLGGDRRR
jgi:hypothetical protein